MAAPLAIVAMSGGVDSSVAAALLMEAGYRVHGVSLRLWDSARPDDPRICSNARDAAAVARHLGIPHTVLDRRADFERRVVRPFVEEYGRGRTPNPCMACNSQFKIGGLLEWSLASGAEVIATGHYARVRRDGDAARLLRGSDPSRDQSYFLFELASKELEHVRFPVGELGKEEVRNLARRLSLPVAEKADSQDLCFGAPAALLAARGSAGEAGEIVGEEGEIVGRHAGIENFTIGQRRGLGVAAPRPLYVRRIDAPARRIVVGETPPRAAGLVATEWRWSDGSLPGGARVAFQTRYRQRPIPGTIETSGSVARIRFEERAHAVAPGQAVVAYRGDEVLGGGWIERTIAEAVA